MPPTTTVTSSEWDDEERWEEISDKPTPAGGRMDPRERHKMAERERRKSMRELFLLLHSFLPHSHTVRKEQSAILDELITYIPLAQSRLRSLRSRRRPLTSTPPAPATTFHANSGSDCDIRVAPEPASSVSIRVRGDRVCVSITDGKGMSQAALLSAVLDELDAHRLTILRSTHCRDGGKLLHYSESKICDGMERTPELLKAKLQELARKLHNLKKPSSSPSSSNKMKRSFDQIG